MEIQLKKYSIYETSQQFFSKVENGLTGCKFGHKCGLSFVIEHCTYIYTYIHT